MTISLVRAVYGRSSSFPIFTIIINFLSKKKKSSLLHSYLHTHTLTLFTHTLDYFYRFLIFFLAKLFLCSTNKKQQKKNT